MVTLFIQGMFVLVLLTQCFIGTESVKQFPFLKRRIKRKRTKRTRSKLIKEQLGTFGKIKNVVKYCLCKDVQCIQHLHRSSNSKHRSYNLPEADCCALNS